MKSRFSVKAETTSFSYVTLHNAAHFSLDEANKSEDGRFYHCLSAMIYSAFCLEAYLNHLGQIEFSDWKKIERRKSPIQKLDMLSKNRNFSPDLSKPPFDYFDKIFAFRKKIAHGQTEHIHIEEIQEREVGDTPDYPATDWERTINLDNASSFVENSTLMVDLLHPIFGWKSKPFITAWKSSWEATPYRGDS